MKNPMSWSSYEAKKMTIFIDKKVRSEKTNNMTEKTVYQKIKQIINETISI